MVCRDISQVVNINHVIFFHDGLIATHFETHCNLGNVLLHRYSYSFVLMTAHNI